MNLGKGGISTTIGPRGTSVNIGKKGTHLNTGIPGTGLSARTKIADGKAGENSPPKVAPPEVKKEGGNFFTIAGGITGGLAALGFLVWLLFL
ncbi:DUF4236 domain-containing protein [Phaeovulum sp.]|uniref:DUF4236 domain-containing protein n=1 Tax=Phaeovulum sp. TaxID=2934796 RepID=UPI0039E5A537